jgi:enoyl-CoA hydratase/carnithine racemase
MVGIIPSIAALIFPMIIGCKKAMELILSGKTIGARDALEEGVKGFVHEIARHGAVVLRKHAYREDERGKGQDGPVATDELHLACSHVFWYEKRND